MTDPSFPGTWLFCYNKKFNLLNADGRWMVFYNSSCIDKTWKKMKLLYQTNRFIGIKDIKVSCKSSSEQIDHVIIFSCGPSYNKEKILRYGRNLSYVLRHEGLKPKSEKLYYKVGDEIKYSIHIGEDLPSSNNRLLEA